MKCLECGKDLRVRKNRTYRYQESGLRSVLLTGIRVFRCAACRTVFPEIPNILELHRSIASALAQKPSPLTGPELRFLRKEIGLKAKDLARHLGTTDVNLSRWETGDTPVNPAADRLVRVLYTLHAVRAQRAVDPAKFVQTFLETFEKIVPTKHPKPLPLEIPAPRRAVGAGPVPAVR